MILRAVEKPFQRHESECSDVVCFDLEANLEVIQDIPFSAKRKLTDSQVVAPFTAIDGGVEEFGILLRDGISVP